MKITRRNFLKGISVATAGLALAEGGQFREVFAAETADIKRGREILTICPYCGVGCGIIVTERDGKIINIEGDPDHPINEGSLCPKGMSISDISFVVTGKNKRVPNSRRLTKVLYRAPGSNAWEEKDWDWALREIALRIKKTRDETFQLKDENGVTVNRTPAIAHLGSASIDNEENYLMHKFLRAIGVINLDHHARL